MQMEIIFIDIIEVKSHNIDVDPINDDTSTKRKKKKIKSDSSRA